MARSLLTSLLALVLAGCGSSGGSVPSEETYAGHLVAAVLPVTGPGIYIGEGLRLQRQIGQAVAADDTFADVLTPSSAGEGHEGEVVIRATVQEVSRDDKGRIKVAVRAMRKTTGEVGLERTYTGSCNRCGSDPAGGALADALKPISRDLRKRYREPAVL
jgi:hypothetical protein